MSGSLSSDLHAEAPGETYGRIARAIAYINDNYQAQPSLDEIASEVGLSAYHFQRLFSDWAGVSPKKFVQFLTLKHAKKLLVDDCTLLDAAYATGLTSAGRLHDLFVNIERMTPGEFKDGGASLQINYSYSDSPFGRLLVASTSKGVCHIAFEDSDVDSIETLRSCFPNAHYFCAHDSFHEAAMGIFHKYWGSAPKLRLHLKGTPFQLKVWECLLKIPYGRLATYGVVANAIDQPTASRAVGTAIGQNPVAYLIPCHRVIRATGQIGDYRWGRTRKSAIIGFEASTSIDPRS